MTLKYLGIHPESEYTGKKYERHLHHSEIIRGKMVNYYEVIEIDEVNTNVSLSSVRKIDKLVRAI
jgi:hypothetical protein